MHKHGFTLVEERIPGECGGTARLWKHDQSGARLLSILNKDENKCFGVSFYTPPQDSTGIAHILEHSVLCGSKKYPVKEPFVELLKGSLQTFLNAFTFPDKTCYPVASANLADFYNLIDVYLDAVFHPLLSENTFRQEGWHIEAASPDDPWTIKGVVFNEMKGVYSSPDSQLAEKSQQSLFPDNIYSLDSGGNPEKIPDLDWQKFCEFHKQHYQPANAYFFFWGDDPEDERLAKIDMAIKNLNCINPKPCVALQKEFGAPRKIEDYYAANEKDDRALFTINWLLPERGNIEEALKMEILDHILTGLSGSPLNRTLLESGLGEDTTGCGLETDLRQMYYSAGLKGIAPENIEKAEHLVFNTLKELAEGGIDKEIVEAAINSVEFAYRENNTGRFPRGLSAMILALSTWLYGGNPLSALEWEKPLKKIKEQAAAGEKIFENALKKYFLENTHRTRVTLLPDKDLNEKRQKKEDSFVKLLESKATPSEKKKKIEETEILIKTQLEPDTQENLATIPRLKISDLPLKNASIPCEIEKDKFVTLVHNLPTNGIIYTNIILPIENVPERLIPLLPLFGRSLTDFGTEKKDYGALALQIASKTGGIGAAPMTAIRSGQPFLALLLSGKAVKSHLDDLFELYREILLEPQKNYRIIAERLSQMIPEQCAKLEYGLQAAGHATVSTRLKAHFRTDAMLAEQMAGLSQLWQMREIEKRFSQNPEDIAADFIELGNIIIGSQNAIVDLAAESESLNAAKKAAESLLKLLPEKNRQKTGKDIGKLEPMKNLPKAEAILAQSQINYVGKGANLYDLGYEFHGSSAVILRFLRMGKLWEEVRVAGGAYGVSCNMDKYGGNFICASYRDPNVEKTISVYDDIGPSLKKNIPAKEQLSQAIIGAVGDMDAYLLPDAKAIKSLNWYLSGESEEKRQQMRNQMLGTTVKDFADFADIMNEATKTGDICVLGGSKTADAAKKHGWKTENMIQ